MMILKNCIVIPTEDGWSDERFRNRCGQYLPFGYSVSKNTFNNNKTLLNSHISIVRDALEQNIQNISIFAGIISYNKNDRFWQEISNIPDDIDILLISGLPGASSDVIIYNKGSYTHILENANNFNTVGEMIEHLSKSINVYVVKNRIFARESEVRLELDKKPPKIKEYKVSCLCMTYCRPDLLEEAIESFHKQKHKNKELIILNDNNKINLIYEHENVKVFNFKNRFKTLGDKRNASLDIASGDILMTWDDDDIHLPSRIFDTISSIDTGMYIGRRWAMLDNHGKYHHLYNETGTLCTAAVTREFLMSARYPQVNGGEDWGIMKKLCYDTKYYTYDHQRFNYIYRAGGWQHATGKKMLVDPYNLSGDIVLEPKWKEDYTEIAEKLIKENPSEYTQMQLLNG
jgi:hypothetical protein